MSVRRASIEDVPTLVEWGRKFYRMLDIPFEYSEERTAESLKTMIEGDDTVILMNSGSAIGGMVAPAWMIDGIMAQEIFWWTRPELRGIGSGREVLEAFERWAREKGAGMIMIAAFDNTTVAEAYKRRGYRRIETHYVRVV